MEPNIALNYFLVPQGVPVIEDKDANSTDIMKCLKELGKVEQAGGEVPVLLFKSLSDLRRLS
jgi:hypothetical protein